MKAAPLRYTYAAATAPMLPLATRAAAADRAGAAGILSAAAMVDLYAQIYAQDDITGDWAANAATLRNAYVGETPDARLAALRQLWDGAGEGQARYSRQVLTAYAAARMPVSADFAGDAPDLVASMLAAGLDANALRWAAQADAGSLAWGQLVLAAPQRSSPVDGGALGAFYGNDDSADYRKSRFLLAGLMGLVTTNPGVPTVLTPMAPDLAAATGLSLEAVLMTQVVGFATVIFPYQVGPLVLAMQLSGEKLGHVLRVTIPLGVLTFLVLMPLDWLWWRALGWL